MPAENQPDVDTQTTQGTPLLSEEDIKSAEVAEDFHLPTNEEVLADEQGQDDNDKDGSPDAQDDASGGDDSGETEQAKTEASAQAEPVEYIEDPGDFVPGDHSFDVQIFDKDGKNPQTVTVKSLDEWDKLLENDPNLGTSANVAKAFRAASKMERDIDDEHKTWEKKKKDYDEAKAYQERQNEVAETWAKEMDYLIAQGELPPITDADRNANWADPKVASQPAVKAQIEVLNYMRDENIKRIKLGLPTITSVLAAYEGFARQRDKKTVEDARKRSGEARKEASAKVAGTSPAPASAAPKGVAVGRIVSLD